MDCKQYSLILGSLILWLSGVDGQQYVVSPGYDYYNPYVQPYSNTMAPRQTIKITASDPRVLSYLRSLDTQELQEVVNPMLLQYYKMQNIPLETPFPIQAIEARNQLYPPIYTDFRPRKVIYTRPVGLNTLKFGGIQNLEPSQLDQEDVLQNNYQIGSLQKRYISNERRAYFGTTDVSSSPSIVNPGQIVDLNNFYANHCNNGIRNVGTFENPYNQGINAFSNPLLNSAQGEIENLLRYKSQDALRSSPNCNITIDSNDLRMILQKYIPISPYVSEHISMVNRRYENIENGNQDSISRPGFGVQNIGDQSINPARPIGATTSNGWNTGNNYQNYPNSWTNSYPHTIPGDPGLNSQPGNNNGQFVNFGSNYPPMNSNGQSGNSHLNYPLTNNYGQTGNGNINYPLANNNGQFGNTNFNYPSTHHYTQSVNTDIKYPLTSNNEQSGNSHLNYPLTNNYEQTGNSDIKYPLTNNHGQSGYHDINYPPMNTNGQSGNSHTNYPLTNNYGQSGNYDINNYSPTNSNGQPGNSHVNYPLINNYGQSVNSDIKYPLTNNNGQVVSPELNFPLTNSNGQTVNPGPNYPFTNSNGQSEYHNFNYSRPINVNVQAMNPNYYDANMNSKNPNVPFSNGQSTNSGNSFYLPYQEQERYPIRTNNQIRPNIILGHQVSNPNINYNLPSNLNTNFAQVYGFSPYPMLTYHNGCYNFVGQNNPKVLLNNLPYDTETNLRNDPQFYNLYHQYSK